MPIAFIAIGALFLIAAVRGTITDGPNGQPPGLLTLLKSDFVSTTAQGNFLVWLVTLWIIGALGYIPGFKPIANALLFLVVLVLVLSNSKNSGTGGIFAQFNAALTTPASGSPTGAAASGVGSGSIATGTSGLNIPLSSGGIGAITPIQPTAPLTIGGAFSPGQIIQVPGLNGIGILGG